LPQREQLAAQPAPPPFESAMRDELARARRLSLGGGVLVASVQGGKAPDPQVVSTVIRTVRSELRSGDLLGQLGGGDIAAVLVRTEPEGVARAAERVRARLDHLARAGQVPPVAVGYTLYPPDAPASPALLVERARRQAGLIFS
jgi:GGDEF domain-containing protein